MGGGKCPPYVRKLPEQLRYHLTLEALQGLHVLHMLAMYFVLAWPTLMHSTNAENKVSANAQIQTLQMAASLLLYTKRE